MRAVHAPKDRNGLYDLVLPHRGQMAILVKRNGRLGSVYRAAIRPFRHRIVYPSLMREFAHEWRAA